MKIETQKKVVAIKLNAINKIILPYRLGRDISIVLFSLACCQATFSFSSLGVIAYLHATAPVIIMITIGISDQYPPNAIQNANIAFNIILFPDYLVYLIIFTVRKNIVKRLYELFAIYLAGAFPIFVVYPGFFESILC